MGAYENTFCNLWTIRKVWPKNSYPSISMMEAEFIETARALHQAFAWNEGFKEYFAIRGNSNPSI